MEQVKCPVCFDAIGNARVTLECGHIHCVSCFVKWSQTSNTCTCCREKFVETTPKVKEKIILSEEFITDIIEHHTDTYKNRNRSLQTNAIVIACNNKSTINIVERDINNILDELVKINMSELADILKNFYE